MTKGMTITADDEASSVIMTVTKSTVRLTVEEARRAATALLAAALSAERPTPEDWP